MNFQWICFCERYKHMCLQISPHFQLGEYNIACLSAFRRMSQRSFWWKVCLLITVWKLPPPLILSNCTYKTTVIVESYVCAARVILSS